MQVSDMCVCAYVCVCVYYYTHSQVCVYIFVYVYTFIHIHIHIHVYRRHAPIAATFPTQFRALEPKWASSLYRCLWWTPSHNDAQVRLRRCCGQRFASLSLTLSLSLACACPPYPPPRPTHLFTLNPFLTDNHASLIFFCRAHVVVSWQSPGRPMFVKLHAIHIHVCVVCVSVNGWILCMLMFIRMDMHVHTRVYTRVLHTHNTMLSGLGGMRTCHDAAHHRNRAILYPHMRVYYMYNCI